jgi:hypothetical protein
VVDEMWSKKCTTCPLYGHLRSSNLSCMNNPKNAHR